MNTEPIPPAAIEAAARAIQYVQHYDPDYSYRQVAEAALRAALPYLAPTDRAAPAPPVTPRNDCINK